MSSSLSPNNEEVAIPKATIKTRPQISPGVFLCRLTLVHGMGQNPDLRRPPVHILSTRSESVFPQAENVNKE
jgi:hypothetical protein